MTAHSHPHMLVFAELHSITPALCTGVSPLPLFMSTWFSAGQCPIPLLLLLLLLSSHQLRSAQRPSLGIVHPPVGASGNWRPFHIHAYLRRVSLPWLPACLHCLLLCWAADGQDAKTGGCGAASCEPRDMAATEGCCTGDPAERCVDSKQANP